LEVVQKNDQRAVELLVSQMRRPDRRRFLKMTGFAGLAIVAGDVLAACGGTPSASSGATSSNKPQVRLTEFTWVGSGQDVQPPKFRDQYTKANPNVTIDFLPGTNSETYPKIVQSLQLTPDNPVVNFGYFNIDATTKGTVAGIWESLDPALIPNLNKVLPAYRRPQDKGVFFSTSAIGLMYNSKLVNPAPTSWADLWDPRFKGKVAFWDSPNWSFNGLVATAKLNGGSEDNIEPGMKIYENAAKAGQIHSLYGSNDAGKQLLVSGTALITPFFFGIMYAWVVNENAPLGYVVPKEGQIAFPLGFQIVKGSSKDQVKAASEVLNLMLAPEAVAEWCNLTFSLPAVDGAVVDSKLATLPAYQKANVANALQLDWQKIAVNNTAWMEQWNSRVKGNLK
jgi:putative spermidine/putrescine transport system substrate-binding protein